MLRFLFGVAVSFWSCGFFLELRVLFGVEISFWS